MIVALSTSAAPRASLLQLIEGCARRGLSALHLVHGHAHGVRFDAPDDVLEQAAAALHAGGVRVAAIEIDPLENLDPDRVTRVCAFFGATLVLREELLAQVRPAYARAATAAGVPMVLGFELNAARENVDDAARNLLESTDPPTVQITLRGGGPEAAQYHGRGIGTLMTRLALSGYNGILTLAPSSDAVLPVWRAWLEHGRNWGCGSKTADPSLVQLA